MEQSTCAFDGCKRALYGKQDLCKAHYLQQWRGTELRPLGTRKPGRPLAERFAEKFTEGPGCWEWTGRMNHRGYGSMFISGEESRLAHRVAWELVNGPIPDDLQVDHMCSNRRCVRPTHLRLVTPAQNSQHMKAARWGSGVSQRGVSYHPKSGKWRARVSHKGTEYTTYHDTPEAAAEAARLKRNELFTHNLLDR